MTRPDVIVVGAGPAGSVAATILARAGARVRLLDRATFPRDKLCGDTVNPGTLERFRRLGMAAGLDRCGLPIDGMRLTGPNGAAVEGRYPRGVRGRAIVRRELDLLLLSDALTAGAEFEPAVSVRGALLDEAGVAGVRIRTAGGERTLRAPITIAADGRRSAMAFGLGLARHPRRPRRWAVGAYVEYAAGPAAVGEMHVRANRYIGVAPVPGGLANVCVVTATRRNRVRFRDPAAHLREALSCDRELGERFARARLASTPVVLGPLAVDVDERGVDGLLLAGDAAGFIDPMTGDGLLFAVRGAELACSSALEALERGWSGVHRRLADRRRLEFASKWRFNRSVRALVGSPLALAAAAACARARPAVFRQMICYAGGVDRARQD
jgi:flavin-dependent dehydrogenase